jgi:hypothetical protein
MSFSKLAKGVLVKPPFHVPQIFGSSELSTERGRYRLHMMMTGHKGSVAAIVGKGELLASAGAPVMNFLTTTNAPSADDGIIIVNTATRRPVPVPGVPKIRGLVSALLWVGGKDGSDGIAYGTTQGFVCVLKQEGSGAVMVSTRHHDFGT